MKRMLRVTAEQWPLKVPFEISRARFTSSQTLKVEISDDEHVGCGECEPHENDPAAPAEVSAIIESFSGSIAGGMTRAELAHALPAGPARNAIDCAMWDLEAKKSGVRAWEIAGIPAPSAVYTAYTIGLGTTDMMGDPAGDTAWTLLKVKLGGGIDDDAARLRFIRAAHPDCDIVIDANGGWSFDGLRRMLPTLEEVGVKLIEQPLPPGEDVALEGFVSPIPLCADESCLDRASLPEIEGRYQFINIKLDKTGGLTEALALAEEAEARGLGIMVGCMTGTSLAMAPAFLVAQRATVVDLDGPLLLRSDRTPSLRYQNGLLHPYGADIWG